MNYQQAFELASKARNANEGKPVANNTRIIKRGDCVAIKLHDTDVVTFAPSGAIILNTGGWKTVTTKDRINSFSPYKVYSDRGTWFAHIGEKRVPFADGVTIYPTGTVKGAGRADIPKREHKTRKAAAAYARAFIDALYAGKVPAPSGGDCWGCCMRDSAGKTVMGSDHVREHLREKYYVPSLLVNAMQAFGTSIAATQTAHAFMHGELQHAFSKDRKDFLAKQLEKTVRRYVLRQLGLSA